MVRDELRDGVEEVLFGQVVLILWGAAHDVVADHALEVSGETACGVGGQAEGERCPGRPSQTGTSYSYIHLHRGLGVDGHSVFPCLAGRVSDNEAPFLTLKEREGTGVCKGVIAGGGT